MKRRDFIAGATLLSLLSPNAWAARRHAAAKKKAANAKAGSAARKSTDSPARSAYRPVTDDPPEGTSASRLPPVKAIEPPDDWRGYEITTTVHLKQMPERARLWLPLPLNQDTLYQRTIGHQWSGNAELSNMRRLPDGDLEVFFCEWKAGSAEEPRLVLTTQVMTADRHFDVARRSVAPERPDILRRNLQSSGLIPNDGAAHQLGARIVGRIRDPLAQAKAIFDWVVDQAVYDPQLPAGKGGDIRAQFETGRFGGRSLEINGLFVALCRAIGIPSRCVHGLRLGPSRLFGKLGLADADATRGQHCRAEFYIPGYGWIPVDASDVRRAAMLEGLTERDSRVLALRKILFGVWEMNWMAYNRGADLNLPGSSFRLPFFTLPRLELGESGDAKPFEYSISVRRLDP